MSGVTQTPELKSPIITSTRDNISRYFRHYEVVKSFEASRLEINNNVYCPHVAYNAQLLGKKVLDKVREKFGPFSPTSWYRCEELERSICKKAFSNWCAKRNLPETKDAWITYFMRKQHPQGGAADIEIVGVSNDDLFAWIKDNLEFDQLIREFPVEGQPMSGWVHVSWNARGDNRNQAFTIG